MDDIQCRPEPAITSWHVGKVSNEQAVEERVLALEPDTLTPCAATGRAREDSAVVYS